MEISRVDIYYIKEKLSHVEDIQKWLPAYIREAKTRAEAGELSMEQMKTLDDAIRLSYFK